MHAQKNIANVRVVVQVVLCLCSRKGAAQRQRCFLQIVNGFAGELLRAAPFVFLQKRSAGTKSNKVEFVRAVGFKRLHRLFGTETKHREEILTLALISRTVDERLVANFSFRSKRTPFLRASTRLTEARG